MASLALYNVKQATELRALFKQFFFLNCIRIVSKLALGKYSKLLYRMSTSTPAGDSQIICPFKVTVHEIDLTVSLQQATQKT